MTISQAESIIRAHVERAEQLRDIERDGFTRYGDTTARDLIERHIEIGLILIRRAVHQCGPNDTLSSYAMRLRNCR